MSGSEKRKRIASWVLAVSLIGNIAMLWAIVEELNPRDILHKFSRSPSAGVAANRPERKRPTAIDSGPHKDSLAAKWTPREVADFLRSNGFPEEVIVRAVMTTIQLGNREERRRISGIATWGRWQLIGGKRPSAEVTLALQNLQRREEEELARLTGVERLADRVREEARMARFGALSPEKMGALAKLEADYLKFRQTASETDVGGGTRTSPEVRSALEREFIQDLASILTPSEVQDYLRYNSDAAHRLQGLLTAVDVDTATYDRLADASLASAPALIAARNDPPKSVELRAQLHDSYRRIIGDEKFLQMAADIDRTVASIDRPFAAAGLTFSERADLFQSTSRTFTQLQLLPLAEQSAQATALLHQLTSSPMLSAQQRQQLESTPLIRLLRRISGGN